MYVVGLYAFCRRLLHGAATPMASNSPMTGREDGVPPRRLTHLQYAVVSKPFNLWATECRGFSRPLCAVLSTLGCVP